MNWTTKAAIMAFCAVAPAGDRIYQAGQERIGNLTGDPRKRIAHATAVAEWLANQEGGPSIPGSRVFEVGTGHVPTVPLMLSILGAEQVITVDLNRRLNTKLTVAAVTWLKQNERQVARQVAHLQDPEVTITRLRALSNSSQLPDILSSARIRYMAPQDAAETGLADDSIDIHLSVTVLEHIPADAISAIMSEARRVLKPTGFAIHFVDPSDHFAHSDPSISNIHFLKFGDRTWQTIAGNEFAYCNRLRAPELTQLLTAPGFEVLREELTIDDRSLSDLRAGFRVNPRFASFTHEELATVELRALLRPA